MTIPSMFRRPARALAALALAGAVGLTGCNDFLTGGELSNDPNNPVAATSRQLFAGVQANLFYMLAGDLPRLTGLLTQQFAGGQGQYYNVYTYAISEQTTNGAQTAVYASGGLRDLRQIQQNARTQGDTLFLGIAQVQEGLLIGTAADIFGDVVYTEALKGTPNPKLDPQLAVYDSVQALLSRAITNLTAYRSNTTNLGPGASDLNYGGNRNAWIALAHTLKARFYLHTAEVRPGAYAQALAEARQGITDPDNDFRAVFSGTSLPESNPFSQFTLYARYQYMVPDPNFVALLESRNDPRLEQYFDVTGEQTGCNPLECLSYFGDATGRGEEGYDQPLVTAQENLLIWAEAAYRTGNQAEARAQLNAEKEIAGVPTVAESLSGVPLLQEILTEKYIALFENIEVFNDYKRTCYPNLQPTVSGVKIPGRLLYDASERQTNTSIPGAQSQPTRNANDPANATDITGARCLGQ